MCAELLAIARGYVALGLSVLPIRADGTKAPCLATWKECQQRQPTEGELTRWFGDAHKIGIAIVCGAISRNLEVLDFDHAETWERWYASVAPIKPELLRNSPQVKTPAGGRHLYLFRNVAGPNRKLAKSKAGKTLIEIKGEGGYVLAPGCAPECHPLGGVYVWERPLKVG